MKRRMGMLLFIGILLASSPSFAIMLDWERNTEVDMRDYNVYACYVKHCVVAQTPEMVIGTVLQPAAATTKPSFVLPPDREGTAAVSALDTSGNESPLSNQVPFDSLKPSTPAGLVVR